jgi:nucleotide-binding universal stress UspA family protein
MPSILLPVAGGPHSGLATDVARQIAAECEAWVDVLHVVPETATARQRQRGRGYLETARQRLTRPEQTTTRLLEADDVADAIVEQSAYYELTVIGAPTTGRLRRFIFGSTNRRIRGSARSVVLSARASQ